MTVERIHPKAPVMLIFIAIFTCLPSYINLSNSKGDGTPAKLKKLPKTSNMHRNYVRTFRYSTDVFPPYQEGCYISYQHWYIKTLNRNKYLYFITDSKERILKYIEKASLIILCCVERQRASCGNFTKSYVTFHEIFSHHRFAHYIANALYCEQP